MATISGLWYMNSTLSLINLTETVNYDFVLEANGSPSYLQHDTIGLTSSKLNAKQGSYTWTPYKSGAWTLETYRAIYFGKEPQTVTDTFYNWMLANAVHYEEVPISGVWVFNSSIEHSYVFAEVNFTDNNDVNRLGFTTYNDSSGRYMLAYYGSSWSLAYSQSSGWKGDAFKTIDFGDTVQYVNSNFYDWLTANATQQQPQVGGTTVIYNGSTIASLFIGDSVTLNCAGKKAKSDITVKFEQAGKILYNGKSIYFDSGGLGQTVILSCSGKKFTGDIEIYSLAASGGSN